MRRTLLKDNNSKKYHTFVILIDTETPITDLQDAKDELVLLSDLPVSIILAGIGKKDFSYIEDEFNSTETIIRDRHGNIITRDFVQCASYNNFRPGKFAENVLRRIPDQFCHYIKTNKNRKNVREPTPYRETDQIL
jgi:hypothetical protein